MALRRELGPGVRLVVIGAGFVGLEVASSAIAPSARRVTVVEPAATPFAATLGPSSASAWPRAPGRTGVDLLLGRGVVRHRDATPTGGLRRRPRRWHTLPLRRRRSSGSATVPNTELVQGQLPLAADGGVGHRRCGPHRVAGVFACGDVASRAAPGRAGTLRLEHWSAAATSARAVASAIVGVPSRLRGALLLVGPVRLAAPGRGPPLRAPGCRGRLATRTGSSRTTGAKTGGCVGAVVVNSPEALAAARRELLATAVASPPARRPIRL